MADRGRKARPVDLLRSGLCPRGCGNKAETLTGVTCCCGACYDQKYPEDTLQVFASGNPSIVTADCVFICKDCPHLDIGTLRVKRDPRRDIMLPDDYSPGEDI